MASRQSLLLLTVDVNTIWVSQRFKKNVLPNASFDKLTVISYLPLDR
jgi:hypothetical protein